MTALPSLRDPPAQRDSGEANPADWAPLPRDFYARPVLELAEALLGCVLISDVHDGVSASTGKTDAVTAGVIVETEAYQGPEDQASHARAGLTRRTAPMFGPPGHAYVYLVYGMHSCLNVVGDIPGRAGAVLLRAIEPRLGVERMRARRGGTAIAAAADARLAAGPARLCQALGITRALDGHDLVSGGPLWLSAPAADRPLPDNLLVGRRVGVEYAGEWAERPWRFGVRGSASLSRPFPEAVLSSDAGPRPARRRP